MRSLSVLGGCLGLGLLLSGTVAPADSPKRPVRFLRGSGCLPLSGDLSAAGDAFRQGFSQGLAESRDSAFLWQWHWTDNGSDPFLSQGWADSMGRLDRTPDLLLAGLGPAIDGFRLSTDSVPCLLLGDGAPSTAGVWPIWPSASWMRQRILQWLRGTPRPIAIVTVASGAWTDVVMGELRDSLPGVQILPHDLDNTRWDEELKQFALNRPRTILFWNRPHEASSLLAKRLGWSVYRQARLLVPEGTVLPDSVIAETIAPVWQPTSPPDSLMCVRYRAWGLEAGRALAKASSTLVRDSLSRWTNALAEVRTDSLAMESMPGGWAPLWSPSISATEWPNPLPTH
ncbi:MAG: hypothetical protein RL173_558 [Fibrobacterota bacterium]